MKNYTVTFWDEARAFVRVAAENKDEAVDLARDKLRKMTAEEFLINIGIYVRYLTVESIEEEDEDKKLV